MPVQGMVFIVECPKAEDVYEQRLEGPALKQVLELSEIKSDFRVAVSEQLFVRALEDAQEAMLRAVKKGWVPALHLSCHANQAEIGVGDSDISWERLAELLRPLNTKLKGNLIVTMSACFGAAAALMAKEYKAGAPFHTLVGPTEDIGWSEGIIGFATFYHLLFGQGVKLDDAVDAMNKAAQCANGTFRHMKSDHVRRVFWLRDIDKDLEEIRRLVEKA
jgi:hypothetical protein